MDKKQKDIGEMLAGMDFSHGRKQAVWGKIDSRLNAYTHELSLIDLDDVAGGLNDIVETDDKVKPPK